MLRPSTRLLTMRVGGLWALTYKRQTCIAARITCGPVPMTRP